MDPSFDRKWNWTRIRDEGMYHGIPLKVYHHEPRLFGDGAWAISSTGLRTILRESPAHYWVTSPYNPHRIPLGKETEAQLIGRAIHDRLLGEKHFEQTFIVRPAVSPHGLKWDDRRGDCKNWKANVSKDLTVITPEQKKTIDEVVWAVDQHPQTRHPNKILRGLVERSLFWKDEETGIWLKARPDAIPEDDLTEACDLKTTRSVLYPDLVRTIQDYGYHQQAALTRTAIAVLFHVKLQAFTFLFVEKTPPYCTALVELKKEEIDRGQRQNEAALRLFKMCKDRNEWPGPMDEDYRRVGLSDYYHEYADKRVREITADWQGEQSGRR